MFGTSKRPFKSLITCCALFLESEWLVDMRFWLKLRAKSWNSDLIYPCTEQSQIWSNVTFNDQVQKQTLLLLAVIEYNSW